MKPYYQKEEQSYLGKTKKMARRCSPYQRQVQTALGIIAATAFLLSIVWVVREIVTGYLAAVDRFWDAFWREFEKVSLKVVPIELVEANAFCGETSPAPPADRGAPLSRWELRWTELSSAWRFVGRPVARMNQDGWTVEVNRVATDGTDNACSFLYGACRKVAFALGYTRILTYTLPEEGGASLRGAGFTLKGTRGGGSWSRVQRPRVDKAPLQGKLLWESVA